MTDSLLDRSTAPGVPRPRRRSGGVLLVVALLVAGVLLAGLVVRGLAALPGLPFGETELDRSTPALLTSLADLEEYHAATGQFQVVVDLERGTRFVPSLVSGERITFLATGSVDAIVDFTDLGGAAVETSEDGRSVVFTLPAARLDEADVDLENSRVISRDRGVLDRLGGVLSDSPTSEREVAARAEDKLDAAAADSDLLSTAEDNTRAMLTSLAQALGYTDVQVLFEAGEVLQDR